MYREDRRERLGIFGGTFAPPHKGHTEAAKTFAQQMNIDRLLIIPAAVPPHKQIDAGDLPEHRLNMCKIAFRDCPRCEVSDMEILRGGKSFTYDTVKELYKPDEREIFLLCGTDMFLTFEEWYKFEEILKMAALVFTRREKSPEYDLATEEKVTEYKKKYGARIFQIYGSVREMSSSIIRETRKNGGDITEYVRNSVADYIKTNGLYK